MEGFRWRNGWLYGVVAVVWSGAAGNLVAAPRTPVIPSAACRVDDRVPSARGVAALRTVQDSRRKASGLGFALSSDRDGRAQVEGQVGDLHFRKSVDPVGRFALDLEAPRDRVHLEVDERGIRITRDREAVTLVQGAAGEAEFEAARRLLAGSRAVGMLRTAAASVMDAEDDAPDSVAVLMADAVAGMLMGDVGAPGRVARYLPRRARAKVQRAALVTSNCYANWEQNTLIASYEWEDCALSFSIWDPVRHVCAFRWVLQVESYWFSFLSCSGLAGFGL